ncbi:MAG: hypothetical protein LBV06_04935 [Propionibacteriaceae bacterium]|jgi:uncharacterized membrane protein YphA (DoxX/SURF4 family)|nr:hypothetical protein [Propionibacteriaceae bacterium]
MSDETSSRGFDIGLSGGDQPEGVKPGTDHLEELISRSSGSTTERVDLQTSPTEEEPAFSTPSSDPVDSGASTGVEPVTTDSPVEDASDIDEFRSFAQSQPRPTPAANTEAVQPRWPFGGDESVTVAATASPEPAPADLVDQAVAPAPAPPVQSPQVIAATPDPEPEPAPVDREFPQGTVDLTEEAASKPAFALAGPGDNHARALDDSLYRQGQEPVPGTVEVDQPVTQPNATVIMPMESQLTDHQAARARALGVVDRGADVITAPQLFLPPSMYKRWPSFALFMFRLVVVAILGIRATQEWMNFSHLKERWSASIFPSPEIFATGQIIVEYAIALMLLLGLASRVAGVVMLALYATVLSFVVWGATNPFSRGVVGFDGQYEVTMAAIGLLFAGLGGGGAAVDAAIHRARLERKNAKLGVTGTSAEF